ncbi:MAG: hypothetical protein A3A28_05665 [Candidatus Sungbacteria bacterium RIFCSPLOWO2_01_FULL_47_32]|uniref:Thioredoxin domain-containing protein n=1 Tax=Candidatus Sungbacteria bacterium RIFCSPHIGHO2_01_FULL_47_32 TaxID=1802264 RepID=A0A1G2K7J5_9BACT|nr:MAG: hypothetical protein A2633_04200 [Candidatus Sungbacteria bacterium RIFCSPHIGHO2_01_FULL_47_32]OGZ98042.1 MAG: hypothetical protein A3D57_02905 [Candidatus Sungbacteria bacterium RIFCSPHIGHO2_02_FULL_46_12]OHA05792.1 MAG: hypothetical protein A3A28_05665 [Candidatus Sungbacteria bacterium RIFCSPLOWO2_01_FULL_47_32]
MENEQKQTTVSSETSTGGQPQGGGFSSSPLSVPVSIVIAGAIIALAVVYSGGTRQGGAPTAGQQAGERQGNTPPVAAVNPADLVGAGDPMLGSPDAKVTVVEFSDFQCPFCGKFFRETESKIVDIYVKTGKVRFVYKHFPFLGNESEWAAQASECAKEQGKFWEYHDYLFNTIWDNYYGKGKGGENVGAFSKANLKKFAVALGLDTAIFAQCLDTEKYKDVVNEEEALGRKVGVQGTPSTFVNGKMIVGAQPFEVFDAAIKEALAQ